MATVKIRYTVQHCPKCNKKLLKVTTGTTIIGSPLLKCKKCGTVCRTNLRSEWYNYAYKKQLWIFPILFPIIFFATTAIMSIVNEGAFVEENLLLGILSAIFGFIFGMAFTIKDIIRMLKSKKRMRNPEYLWQLLICDMISRETFEQFMREADK